MLCILNVLLSVLSYEPIANALARYFSRRPLLQMRTCKL